MWSFKPSVKLSPRATYEVITDMSRQSAAPTAPYATVISPRTARGRNPGRRAALDGNGLTKSEK
ncbi:hypothetical protein Plo01_68820 [Planobispora longispora]|uniref:Uncharacterized protein n=1 Tax=Planobispora longispora TaxID=28887 RepID=A0A8J3RSS9_9ACTN|nr:hypothetical protein Plo01_68820 [Planobispora longispora]